MQVKWTLQRCFRSALQHRSDLRHRSDPQNDLPLEELDSGLFPQKASINKQTGLPLTYSGRERLV